MFRHHGRTQRRGTRNQPAGRCFYSLEQDESSTTMTGCGTHICHLCADATNGDRPEQRPGLAQFEQTTAQSLFASDFLELGSPWENGYSESFHRRVRDGCLGAKFFFSRGGSERDRGSAFALQSPKAAQQPSWPDPVEIRVSMCCFRSGGVPTPAAHCEICFTTRAFTTRAFTTRAFTTRAFTTRAFTTLDQVIRTLHFMLAASRFWLMLS